MVLDLSFCHELLQYFASPKSITLGGCVDLLDAGLNQASARSIHKPNEQQLFKWLDGRAKLLSY